MSRVIIDLVSDDDGDGGFQTGEKKRARVCSQCTTEIYGDVRKQEKREKKKSRKETADDLYMSTASRGRDYWFELVKSAEGSIVWPVLALPGNATPGARGSKPRVNLQVHNGTVNFTRRTAIDPVMDAVKDASQHGRRYVWLPIQLSSSNAKHQSEQHANALFFDLKKREVWVFEPHGGEVENIAQGHFRNFYRRHSYEEAIHKMLDPLDMRIHLPNDYMPPLFGQAITGDRWCVLWTLLFFDGATRQGPLAFIKEWENASLQHIQFALLNARHWMIVHPSYVS